MMTRVLPEPGPARIRLNPSGAVVAASWAGFSSFSKSSRSPSPPSLRSRIFRIDRSRPDEVSSRLPRAASIASLRVERTHAGAAILRGRIHDGQHADLYGPARAPDSLGWT